MLLSRVYVMTFLVCQQCFVLFYFIDRVYAMKFEVFQQCFLLLSRVHVMMFEVCQQYFKSLLTYIKLHYINTG
jgi:hypothetical protein